MSDDFFQDPRNRAAAAAMVAQDVGRTKGRNAFLVASSGLAVPFAALGCAIAIDDLSHPWRDIVAWSSLVGGGLAGLFGIGLGIAAVSTLTPRGQRLMGGIATAIGVLALPCALLAFLLVYVQGMNFRM